MKKENHRQARNAGSGQTCLPYHYTHTHTHTYAIRSGGKRGHEFQKDRMGIY